MFDPLDLTQLHSVRVLADFIRRHFGVWCGFLTLGGEATPIGQATRYAPMPVCHAFQSRFDGRGSCTGSVRRWGEALRNALPEGETLGMTCHGHLSARVRPIRHHGAIVGGLYASGFLLAEDEGVRQRVTRRLREIGHASVPATDAPTLNAERVMLLDELMDTLIAEIEAVLEERAPQRREAAPTERYRELIGHAPPMLELFRTLDKIRNAESTVLIQGENGTGKELLARAIHFNSPRRDRPFVVQNCSALNDNLLDSELFGHKRGAFTGAITDKLGLFDIADGGTFFLDEVGDMSPTLQVKLLRVLQEGTFVPVGDTVTRKVDVRIIAATHRDLKQMIRESTFRQDLYYRLNVINLVSPPLRERREDIPALVDHFVRRAARQLGARERPLDEATLRHILAYDWPGNVRELENEIERLVVLAGDEPRLGPHLLSRRIQEADGLADDLPSERAHDLHGALETLERRMLVDALRRCGWNKSRAARELGVSRRNLIRKVQEYDLERYRDEP